MTQPELFEELQTNATSTKRRQEKPIFAAQRLSWSATYQQLALAGAVVILVFVATFAYGIEQGKSLARAAWVRESSAPALAANAGPLIRPTGGNGSLRPMTGTAAASTAPAAAPVVGPRAAPSTTMRPAASTRVSGKSADTNRQYTIQLATYANRDEAAPKLAALKKSGYSAYINEGSQHVSLCVGLYPTREKAAKQLGTFRKKYHDCFVRLR